MENSDDLKGLSHSERIKIENSLLKMKLTAEFGMTHSESDNDMDDDFENLWLKHLYNFEKSYSDSKRVKVFDYIGKPEYRKECDITDKEIESEFNRLMKLLKDCNIKLDFLCDYAVRLKYKFITEELFEEETDDIKIDGLMHCFVYEEFHPNHEYDLKNYTRIFFSKIFENYWNKDFDSHSLHKELILNGELLTNAEAADKIENYQNKNKTFDFDSISFDDIQFDISKKRAETTGIICLRFKENLDLKKLTREFFRINFEFDLFDFWVISSVEFDLFRN